MSEITARALQMQLDLGSLMKARGLNFCPKSLPLVNGDDRTITVFGLASTVGVDLSFQKFRGWAFDNLCTTLRGFPKPPLLFKHDPSQVAGTIESLGYDDRGNLRIVAEVTHEQARRCPAFSVAARIIDYEIIDNGGDDFYALIKRAELTEISMTDCPANPQALVQSRYRTPPASAYIKCLASEPRWRLPAFA